MQICKQCQKVYNPKETKRVFGDVWWASIYCTAQCYTTAMNINKGRVAKDKHEEEMSLVSKNYYEQISSTL